MCRQNIAELRGHPRREARVAIDAMARSRASLTPRRVARVPKRSDLANAELTARLHRALAHPLRARMVQALQTGPKSATELSMQLDERLGNTAYHLKILRSDGGILEYAGGRRARGAFERYYRRKPGGGLLAQVTWAEIPEPVRAARRGAILDEFLRSAIASLRNATIDVQPGSVFGSRPLRLDKEGWDQACEAIARAQERIAEAESASAKRLGRTAEKAGEIQAILGTYLFPSAEAGKE
jgi:DNA-binding transcriptional ArsR family regulator